MVARANGAEERATGDKAILRVDRYQRLGDKTQSQVGSGTYGVVYVAWDSVRACLVAIREQPVKSGGALAEMCVMQKVGNHPRLVHLINIGLSDNNKLVTILEYLPSSLADVFRRARGFLDTHLCYSYGRQVLEAVNFLHTKGVVHRDISLNNILVDERQNAAKLADFGMAASADTFIFDRTVTALNYRAPEVILHMKLPDGQTPLDMWSLATVWAVLWSATNMFQGKSVQDVFRMHSHVLGGTPVPEWPECCAAPKWGEVEDALVKEFPHSAPRDFFLSSSEVRRPLHGHEQMIDLLCKVFKWRPCTRLSACHALDHPAWKHVPQPAEPPPPEKHELRRPALREETELCKCKGHCGQRECNRNKARIHYLKKMSKKVVDEYICRNPLDTSDPRGRCFGCQEASGTPTRPVSQKKASDAQARNQKAKNKQHVKSKPPQKRRRDTK